MAETVRYTKAVYNAEGYAPDPVDITFSEFVIASQMDPGTGRTTQPTLLQGERYQLRDPQRDGNFLAAIIDMESDRQAGLTDYDPEAETPRYVGFCFDREAWNNQAGEYQNYLYRCVITQG